MDIQGGRVLVVDDNEMNRDMLARRLAKRGFDVEVAENGVLALEAIEEHDFDLVLLDINMPDMDGFEVLERVREGHSAASLPVLMATARDDSEDIVRALQMGANDYVTKPLDFPVVLARVGAHLSLKKSKDALVAAHGRMKKDLDAAARFQQSLLPRSFPTTEAVRCAWRYRPCTELAGDALNVFPIDDTRIGLYLLDVSGHGVSASLLSVTVTHSLTPGPDVASVVNRPVPDATGNAIARPAEVATRLNELYPMASNGGHYFTLAYAVLDTDERLLRIVTAGQPEPLHLRRGEATRSIQPRNLPIGLFPSVAYEDVLVEVSPGDRIYLFSDGLMEAANGDGEEFGRSRLVDAARSALDVSLEQSLDAIIEAATHWQGREDFDDDLSIVAIEMQKS